MILLYNAVIYTMDERQPRAAALGTRGGWILELGEAQLLRLRTMLKPTYMIGGYAQQSYGFNYYGTVGANRDEFVIVRKMDKVDWLDRPASGEKEAAE